MSEFEITLNERGGYGILVKERVTADEFKVLEGTDCTHGASNERGDLILTEGGRSVGAYKSSRWLNIKLVSGENDV